jgi:hypothetical protein
MRQALKSLDFRLLLAFGLPFVVYLRTLAPTVYNLDSAELTTAVATGGIVRSTGYPLYLLLGRVWAAVPVGDVGFRLNLFSACTGALTVALAARILTRWQVGPWATLGALGLLAFSVQFWGLSLIAEVYTLHTALMALLILLLLRWREAPSPGRLALATFVFGLSLSHHLATVLLGPACLWYVLSTAPRRALASRALVAAAGTLLLGLSVYLYLPLQASLQPAFNYAGFYDAQGIFRPVDLATPGGLWWLMSGRRFAAEMFAYRGVELIHETAVFGRQFWQAFFAVGIGPGLLGIIVLLRRDVRLALLLLLMAVAHAAFYIDYRVADKDLMFLPVYLIWALFLGVGYQSLLDWVRSASGQPRGIWTGRALTGVIVSAVIVAALWNRPLADQSDDYSARDRGEAILQVAEPGALIFGWWETVPVLQYLQLVEGRRPDVQPVSRWLVPPDALQAWAERETHRRPVYIDAPPAGLAERFRFEPSGPVYRVLPR